VCSRASSGVFLFYLRILASYHPDFAPPALGSFFFCAFFVPVFGFLSGFADLSRFLSFFCLIPILPACVKREFGFSGQSLCDPPFGSFSRFYCLPLLSRATFLPLRFPSSLRYFLIHLLLLFSLHLVNLLGALTSEILTTLWCVPAGTVIMFLPGSYSLS